MSTRVSKAGEAQKEGHNDQKVYLKFRIPRPEELLGFRGSTPTTFTEAQPQIYDQNITGDVKPSRRRRNSKSSSSCRKESPRSPPKSISEHSPKPCPATSVSTTAQEPQPTQSQQKWGSSGVTYLEETSATQIKGSGFLPDIITRFKVKRCSLVSGTNKIQSECTSEIGDLPSRRTLLLQHLMENPGELPNGIDPLTDSPEVQNVDAPSTMVAMSTPKLQLKFLSFRTEDMLSAEQRRQMNIVDYVGDVGASGASTPAPSVAQPEPASGSQLSKKRKRTGSFPQSQNKASSTMSLRTVQAPRKSRSKAQKADDTDPREVNGDMEQVSSDITDPDNQTNDHESALLSPPNIKQNKRTRRSPKAKVREGPKTIKKFISRTKIDEEVGNDVEGSYGFQSQSNTSISKSRRASNTESKRRKLNGSCPPDSSSDTETADTPSPLGYQPQPANLPLFSKLGTTPEDRAPYIEEITELLVQGADETDLEAAVILMNLLHGNCPTPFLSPVEELAMREERCILEYQAEGRPYRG